MVNVLDDGHFGPVPDDDPIVEKAIKAMDGITEEELEALRSSKNESEWNAACDRVKKAHHGYPYDWYEKVLASGLTDEVAKNWGKPDAFEIHVEPLIK